MTIRTTPETALARVQDALTAHGCRGRGTSWQCPAHEDRAPSLSVANGSKGVVLTCHAGCATEDVVAALGLTMADLFDEPLEHRERPQVVAEYPYHDENGKLLLTVKRLEPGYNGARKTFRQFAPDGTPKVAGIRRVLYRLPEVLAEARAGGTVFICEGEKDVDSLRQAAGVVATCNIGGAGKWRDEYTLALRGASEVVVIADRDKPGRAHAIAVADSLRRAGIPVRVMEPARGKDVTDHLAHGLGYADLQPLADDQEDAPPPEDPVLEGSEAHFEARVNGLIAELLDTDDLDKIPNLEPLVTDVLFMDTLGRINGPSGHGKSFVSLDFAGHIATGMDWHGRRVRQGSVIYLVAEGAKGIRKRVRAWEQHHGRKMTGVRFLPRPVQAMDPEWLVLIEACRRLEPALVIIDTQARVTVGVEENSATEMGRVIDRMEQLRAATGACILLIHHKGLNGDHGRGSTAVRGAMQTELTVTKEGKGPDTRIVLGTDKQKDNEEIGKLVFQLKQVALDGEAEEDGRPVTSAVLVLDDAADADEPQPPQKLAPAARKLLDALRALDRPVSRAEVVDKVAEIYGHGLTREVSSRHLNDMARDGLVERIDATDSSVVLWAITDKGRK